MDPADVLDVKTATVSAESEGASLLGEGVGKDLDLGCAEESPGCLPQESSGLPRTLHCEDAFLDDAHGIMQIMVHYIQAGFEADDQTREYVHEAALFGMSLQRLRLSAMPRGRVNFEPVGRNW